MRLLAYVAWALLVTDAAVPGSTRADEARTVKVGCMYPMTGRGGLYGHDSVAAIKLATDELNARGGAAGRRLEVLVEDSQSKPAFAVRIAERFLRESKVNFLCGAVSSAVGLAVSEVARAQRVIFVGTDHASSRLTLENFNPYYFRVSNNTYQSMAAGALYLRELQGRIPWTRIAFVGPDYEYGRTMWSDLRSKLDELGVQYRVVGEFWPKLYEPDFRPYIGAILRAEPEVLVNGHWGGDLVVFIRQAKTYELFTRTRFLNFDAGANYEVMAALGEEMPTGLALSARHHNNWPDTEYNRSFVKRFHAATGRYPSYAAHGAYSGTLAIAAVVEQVGDAEDTPALIAAFERLKLKLPKDPDGFESYMDPLTHQMVQVQAIGEVVRNTAFPPATTMLGNWKVYPAEQLMPTRAILRRRLAPSRLSAISRD